MSLTPALADCETLRTACARVLIRSGVDEKTGEGLSTAALTERVAWCAALVHGMTVALLCEHRSAGDVDVLASGKDAEGRPLPSKAWMALRRLGWTTRAPEAIPGGSHLPASIIRARTRQIAAFERIHKRLPVDVFELEPDWRVARMLLLPACDKQQATVERSDDGYQVLLRLQLPTRPDPAGYQDWTWVACRITLPPTVPANAVIHLPVLRVEGGQVRADMAWTHPVPRPRHIGHTVALGVDWGLNTLLSAGVARLHDDGRITTVGCGAQFRAAGVLAKQHRLRRISESLHAKTTHYALLATPAPHDKAAKLAEEIRRVSQRRSNLNDALAWSAARWTVDQAIAAGATVVYLEDLRSLEAGGMGHNTRISQTVRGRIADRIRHIAAEVGIAVVSVPPRNTSKHCPECLTPLRHRKAPDRPMVAGWKWAICLGRQCGWQGDRDQGAWRRIAARGLAHQTKTDVDRTTGIAAIRTVVDVLEAKAVVAATPVSRRNRSKIGPTRRRTHRLAPRRREVPSPAAHPYGAAGQRPEGHAPTDRLRLPRAAHRHQGVTTISTPASRHRPRGAALGAGFHLHAHASPPRWAVPTLDTCCPARDP